MKNILFIIILKSFLFYSLLYAIEIAPFFTIFHGFNALKKDRTLTKLDLVSMRGESFYLTKNNELKFSGYGYLWTKKSSYSINNRKKVIVKIDLKTDNGEVIIAFSKNRQDWRSGIADALTFSIRADKNNVFHAVVRTKMYKNFIDNTPITFIPLKWHTITIEVDEYKLVSYIDDIKIKEIDISTIQFPLDGYIGLAQFNKNKNTYIKNFYIEESYF